MTKQEEFLVRWARLKREATGKTQSNPADVHPPEAEELLSVPAPLPTVESITGTSDIRLFLESNVPTELVRAALRAAWATDPAIRDFVGIAESQWDFNNPNAMPGFGPLEELPSAQSIVTPSAPHVDSAPVTAARKMEMVNPGRDGQVDNVWLSSGMNGRNRANEDTNPQAAHPPQENAHSVLRRHGGALPK